MKNRTFTDIDQTILMVDDIQMNINVISAIFESAPVSTIGVNSAPEAMKKLKTMTPTLILLDIVMPEIDGFELCNILKESDEYKDIPVIFISGNGKPEQIVKGFELGAIDFIVKPFNRDEVFARITAHLHMIAHQTMVTNQNVNLENRYNLRTEELHRVNKQLRIQENQLSSIINNSQALIYLKDLSGEYLLVNKKFETVYGFSQSQVIGKNDYSFFGEKIADRRWANDWKALMSSSAITMEEVISTNEEIFTYLSTKFTLYDDDANPYAICNLSTDITELKKTSSALETLNSDLERKVKERTEELQYEKERADAANAAKSNFLANMSHEIRTPMNGILGYTKILQQEELDTEKSGYLDVIETSGEALLSLINDILDLSKIESGKMELQYEEISLTDLINEVKALFVQDISNRDVTFITDVIGIIPGSINIDRIRIRQVLINIIANAFKFTKKGYVKYSTEVEQSIENPEKC